MMDLKQPGIYKITNTYNRKIYIGSAINIKNRWKVHKEDFKYDKHGNVYLLSIYKKYGLSNLVFEVIEFCSKEWLLIREQHWIDILNTVAPNGYNILAIAGSRLGTKHTDATKAKLKEARNKRGPTKDETRLKMSATRSGRTTTPEWREKLSKAHLGKKKPRKLIISDPGLVRLCKPQTLNQQVLLQKPMV